MQAQAHPFLPAAQPLCREVSTAGNTLVFLRSCCSLHQSYGGVEFNGGDLGAQKLESPWAGWALPALSGIVFALECDNLAPCCVSNNL